jgi:hypothetical protein
LRILTPPYGSYRAIPGFQPPPKSFSIRLQLCGGRSFFRPSVLPKSFIWSRKIAFRLQRFDDLNTALKNPNHVLEEAPFTAEIVDAMRQVSRETVPDMPDRIVSARRFFWAFPHSSAATAASALPT